MKSLKKSFTFVLFILLSFGGLFFGCTPKYDNVKVTSDKDETGIQLYLGEDTDQNVLSVAEVTFTVSGLEDGAQNLKFNFEGNEESRIVSIEDKKVKGDSVTLTIKAIAGGSTNLVAITEQGNKRDSVKIDCIKRATSMQFNTDYKPAMFKTVGSNLVVNSKNIIFEPFDTTQNQVTYSLKQNVPGLEISPSGVLTVTGYIDIDVLEVEVVATNIENNSLSATTIVHLLNPLADENNDGINLVEDGVVYTDNTLVLTTTGVLSSLTLTLTVNTLENIGLAYELENYDETASGTKDCITIEQNLNQLHMYANDIGLCKIKIKVLFLDYTDAPHAEKTIYVRVIELPKTITVNQNTSDFSDYIYTYYENNLGQEYVVNIGDYRAYNKQFVLAVDNEDNIKVCRNDGQEINLATIINGKLVEGDVLQSGQSVFITGLKPNQTTKLYVVACGTLERQEFLYKTITLKTLLGSENITPQKMTIDDVESDVFYVEVGKSFNLNYTLDEGTTAYGLKLLASDGSEINSVVDYQFSGSEENPVITITGKELGEVYCKLLLDNLVESKPFVISTFAPINYASEDNQTGGVFFKTESPLENKNIAEVQYEKEDNINTLKSFVLSLGTGVQLDMFTNPTNATVLGTKYYSVFVADETNAEEDASEFLGVSRTGYVIAKKLASNKNAGRLAIKVETTSLKTDAEGKVTSVVSTRYIAVEIYIPLSNVNISSQKATIYWNSDTLLNPTQRINAETYSQTLNLSLYPNSINYDKVQIEWDCPSELSLQIIDKSSVVVQAYANEDKPEVSVYTVTATVKYYSTVIVKKCVFNVIKSTRATALIANVDDFDNTTAYFELLDNNFEPADVQINSAVYSKTGDANVSFDKVYYRSLNEDIATVNENGLIKPVSAGKTQIIVYAEDMMTSLTGYGSYKVINVIVADGLSKKTALRIRDEESFAKICTNPDYFYYFANDVILKKSYSPITFNGYIIGNGYTLSGVNLSKTNNHLFAELSENATIQGLNIEAKIDVDNIDENLAIALIGKNNGNIYSVNINYEKAQIGVAGNVDIKLAGLAIENDGIISNSTVSADFRVLTQNNLLSSLVVGGIVAVNNSQMIGNNNNYQHTFENAIQEYDFVGSITIQNASANNSAIGGIVAVNNGTVGSNNHDSILGQGFAVSLKIDANNIDNVGGIAGINNADISNSLVNADILAKDNVGGVVGKNQVVENMTSVSINGTNNATFAVIDNSVVELYQGVSKNGYYEKIKGQNNVGGVVGFSKNGKITNSYIKAYHNGCEIVGQNNIGGVVGYAESTKIQKSYAHILTTVENQTENSFAGGIAGFAKDVKIENAYAITNSNATNFGLAVGKAEIVEQGIVVDANKVQIANFYATDNSYNNFVNDGDIETVDCFKSNNDLTSISTYANWSITNNTSYSEYDWFISQTENDGYPVLVYEKYLMRKLQPTSVYINVNEEYNTYSNLVILDVDKIYRLSDILSISTDMNSKSTVYVYDNNSGVLNAQNRTNVFTSRATLYSKNQTVSTITFVLGNDVNISASIQVAFIKKPTAIKIDDVNVRLNQSISINSQISFDADESEKQFEILGESSIYKLGIDYMDNIDVDASIIELADMFDIDGGFLFNGNVSIRGNIAGTMNPKISLYYVLQYVDLDGVSQSIYIKLENVNYTPEINVYTGATAIYTANSKLDITLLDETTFVVNIDTDKVDEKLLISTDSDEILFENNNSNVVLDQNSKTGNENSKLVLYVKQCDGVQDNKLSVTFGLKFNDSLKDYSNFANKASFNKIFDATINFVAESERTVSTDIEITANPQNLLKIDLTNYPAGKKNGTIYEPVIDFPANTLTPGEKGLLVVDIYPEYAYYDELQVVSDVDSNGYKITFIQLAKNGDKYIELKPNTDVIENGILLIPYSNVYFENGTNNAILNFDGRFYLNTLIGSKVEKETIFNITVTGITYARDDSGNYLLDDNNNRIIEKTLSKTLAVVVNPAPDLELTQSSAEDTHSAPVYVDQDEETKQNYNLVYLDEELTFDVELKYGLTSQNTPTFSYVVERYNGAEYQEISSAYVKVSEPTYENGVYYFKVKFDSTKGLVQGDKITFYSSVVNTVNGFEQKYESNRLTYFVVDYILTGITVDNVENGLMNVKVNNSKELNATIDVLNGSKEPENLDDLLNKDVSFWSDVKGNTAKTWSFDNANISKDYLSGIASYTTNGIDYYVVYQTQALKTKLFDSKLNNKYVLDNQEVLKDGYNIYVDGDEYYLYKTIVDGQYEYYCLKQYENGDFDYVINTESELSDIGIYPISTTETTPKIRLELSYYYQYNVETNMFELKIESGNSSKGKLITKEFGLDIKLNSDMDNPIAVYTVDEFYQMKEGLDYILMNDLEFGLEEEDGTHAQTYTPFVLNASSLDGNMHKITFNGQCFNFDGTNTANISLFTEISANSIVKNLDIVYSNIVVNGEDEDKIVSAQYLNFAGMTITNLGVVSNCFVYINGDISINAQNADGQVQMAGFAITNSGKITYSSVYGVDFNKSDFENGLYNSNTKLYSSTQGDMAGFVVNNSDLISSCEVEFLGVENSASPTKNVRVAGFVVVNSGRVYESGAAGQRLDATEYTQYAGLMTKSNITINDKIFPLSNNDSRINVSDIYFATLKSNSNIAGFVYKNSGEIENTYSAYPMETQSRTAGFVYDNSNNGKVLTSYTISSYVGKNVNTNAYAPFVGTNELGEVNNNSQTSEVRYCYYLTSADVVYEEDILFKEPASKISIDLVQLDEDNQDLSDNEITTSNATKPGSYVGFNIGSSNSSIWNIYNENGYVLPTINSINYNKDIETRKKFKRPYTTIIVNNQPQLVFGRVTDDNPYQIANATQFVNVFNEEAVWYNDETNGMLTAYLDHDIRLINDIDLSEYAGTDALNRIRYVVYNGDFDGNGMTISGINLLGNSSIGNLPTNATVVQDSNPYVYTKSSFGLFNQIGTATVAQKNTQTDEVVYKTNVYTDENIARIRNLTIKVNEVSKSTSKFTGILAGLIVNTDIVSLKIKSDNVTILGRNVTGGVAGAIIGNSSLYNVSVNASVTSTYQYKATNAYSELSDAEFELISNYKFMNYFEINNQNTTFTSQYENLIDNRLLNTNKELSYAGGVAGIIDVYSSANNSVKEDVYDDLRSNNVHNLMSNVDLVTVYGNISISGEIVGGLFGTINEDTYIKDADFEVSITDSQRLNGLFTAGGLVGINNGGYIVNSKIEVASQSADSYDNDLTNKTGNSLFGINNYPYAIGGLVGIEYGGTILSSYSKTNVINKNAKYAGGIAGYMTDFVSNYQYIEHGKNGDVYIPQYKYGAYVLMEEVYTTGNVFAGDKYDTNNKINYVYDEENKTETYTLNPTSYAGGIAGYYKPLKQISTELGSITNKNINLDRFNGVIGINAFHKPSNYTISSEYKMVKDNDSGRYNVEYSNIMTGFTGERKLSNGIVETVTFNQRCGSVFGYVDGEENVNTLFKKSSGAQQKNLFTSYVYDSANITYANRLKGNKINHIANLNSNLIDVDVFTFTNDLEVITEDESLSGKVTLNSDTTDVGDKSKIKIDSSETYFVLRGYGKNSGGELNKKYQQNNKGIYYSWSEIWQFENPVYPKFKPYDLAEYIFIQNENDLMNMRPGSNYKLIKDIYLTKPWTEQLSLSYIKLTSAKRHDGLGINGSEYYAIYNINMKKDSTGNSENYGFFNSLRKSTITNINFVFGTSIKNPYLANDKGSYVGDVGYSFNGAENNVGMIAGVLSLDTTFKDCNIYLNTTNNGNAVEYKINSTAVGDVRIGVLTGAMVDNSSATSTKIYAGVVTHTDEIRKFEQQKLDLTITTNKTSENSCDVKVGGVAGLLKESVFNNVDIENINLNYIGNEDIANVGGIVGLIENSARLENVSANNFDIVANNTSDSTCLYIGGLAGKLSKGVLTKNIDGVLNGVNDINISASGKAQSCYIGGFVGNALEDGLIEYYNSNNQISIFAKDLTCEHNICIGGIAGQSDAEIDNLYIDRDISIQTDNIVANNIYIGGIAGQLNGKTNDVSNSKNITIKANGSANSQYFGGIAGLEKASSIKNVNIDNLLLEDNINTTSNAFVGGGVGRIEANSNVNGERVVENCFVDFDKLEVTGNTNVFYVAGFVGGISNEINPKLDSICAQGTLIFDGIASKNYIAGFASSTFLNLQDNLLTARVINSVANVDILFTKNGITVAGFACEGFNQISNSVCLGDLIFAKQITKEQDGKITYTLATELFTGTASGFVTMDDVVGETSSTALLKNNISLSTLKLIGDNTRAVAFNSDFGVGYNYNLSGVVNSSDRQNTKNIALSNNLTQPTNLTFKNLVQRVNSIVDTSKIDSDKLNILTQGDKDYYSYSTPYTTGYVANDSLIGANIGDVVQNGFDIETNLYFAGLIVEDNLINKNNGYIFNCLAEGTSNQAGFVKENNALVNACGTNRVVGAFDTDRAGFVLVNNGIVANSYAVNVFKNYDNSRKDASNNPISINGFVAQNNGVVKNSFASPSVFDLSGSYSNVYGFTNSNNATLINCYYDNSFNGKVQGQATALSYSKTENNVEVGAIAKTAEMFAKNSEKQTNYAYATALSFNNSLKSNNKIGYLDTGNNTSDNMYIINNAGRYNYIIGEIKNTLSKNIYAKLANDIDFYNTEIEQLTGATVSIQNDELLALCNVSLNSNGLFTSVNTNSANLTANIQNLGVVGKFANQTISQTSGLLIGVAKTANITNSYAILTEQIALNNENASFGLIAGEVKDTNIQNSFASGDIVVGKAKNVGTLVGKITGTSDEKIKSSFASGYTKVQNTAVESISNDIYIGGLVGNAGSTNFDDCYSNVSLQNYVYDTNYNKAKVGAISGYAGNGSAKFNEYISLTDKVAGENPFGTSISASSLSVGKMSLGNFAGNLIVEQTINTLGSKTNPISVTDSTEFENDKTYYVASDLTIKQMSSYPKMIVSNGNQITIINTSSALIYASEANNKTIVSGLVIKDGALVNGTFAGYAYKTKTIGTINLEYGFAYALDGAVLDNCSVDATLTEEWIYNIDGLSSSAIANIMNKAESSAGLAINSKNNTKIKDISVKTINDCIKAYTIGDFTTSPDYDSVDVSGMFNVVNGQTYIIGNISVDLTVKHANTNSFNNKVSGIINDSSYLNNLHFVDKKIDSITFDANAVNVGGISSTYNSSNTILSDLTITNFVVANESQLTSKVGGLFGTYSATNSTLSNITIKNVTYQLSSVANIADVGGLVGTLSSGTITNCSVEKFTFAQGKADSVGGLIGWQQGGTLSQSNIGLFEYSGDFVTNVGGAVGNITNNSTVDNISITECDIVNGKATNVGGAFGNVAFAGSDIPGLSDVSNISVNKFIAYANQGATMKLDYVGGLVGKIVDVSITGTNKVTSFAISTESNDSSTNIDMKSVGGIAGYCAGSVAGNTSVETFNISYGKATNVGGIAGELAGYGTITTSATYTIQNFDYSNPTDNTIKNIGGVVGFMSGSDDYSFILGVKVKDFKYSGGISSNLGGVVGLLQSGSVSNVTVDTFKITGGSFDSYKEGGLRNLGGVGGIVGSICNENNDDQYLVNATVNSFTASGGKIYRVGGIVGLFYNGTIYGSISVNTFNMNGNCKSTYVGGVAGSIQYGKLSGATTVINFNINTSVSFTDIGGVVGFMGGTFNGSSTIVENFNYYSNNGKSNNVGGAFGEIIGSYDTNNDSYSCNISNVTVTNFNFVKGDATNIGGIFGSVKNANITNIKIENFIVDDVVNYDMQETNNPVGDWNSGTTVYRSTSSGFVRVDLQYIYTHPNDFYFIGSYGTHKVYIGGVVGVMESGKIVNITLGNISVNKNNKGSDSNPLYVGTVVGSMSGGTIKSCNTENLKIVDYNYPGIIYDSSKSAGYNINSGRNDIKTDLFETYYTTYTQTGIPGSSTGTMYWPTGKANYVGIRGYANKSNGDFDELGAKNFHNDWVYPIVFML